MRTPERIRRARPPAGRARTWVLLALVPAAFGLFGCGESKEQKAEKTVCAARSEIKEKVSSLQSVTPDDRVDLRDQDRCQRHRRRPRQDP